MAKKTKAPPLLDNPRAPDIFADEATGFYLAGDNVRITLSSYRVNHTTSPGPLSRVVIGRLVMPILAAEALHRSLADFLARMKAKSETSSGPVTVQ
jgi:hypothetical protein